MKDLFLIPARGGSKGIPGKNIKPLGGRPLIYYTLDAAFDTASPQDICVSTDDDTIAARVREYGLDIPFKRPSDLATDTAGSDEVMLHAVAFYEKAGIKLDRIVLLQPTSPFRTSRHITEALELYHQDLDMVVSVKKTKANPYFNLFEEDKSGYLRPSKPGNFSRRQDCPAVYEYNGAVYVINVDSLKNKSATPFSRILKYEMNEQDSIDIDTEMDWLLAEAVMAHSRLQKKEEKPS
jgi:N-acylneuraminate cytidylyltransferase